jgi:hypothetical protein
MAMQPLRDTRCSTAALVDLPPEPSGVVAGGLYDIVKNGLCVVYRVDI